MKTTEFEQTPEQLIETIRLKREGYEKAAFTLAQLFSNVRRHKTYRIKGYKSFGEFVEGEYDLPKSIANRLVGIWDFFTDDVEMAVTDMEVLGIDKLGLLRPVLKKLANDEEGRLALEGWIEFAGQSDLAALRERIQDEKPQAKDKTIREMFVDQFLENILAEFNCSRKELDYKLAIYFQDRDLSEVKREVKTKISKLELESGEAA